MVRAHNRCVEGTCAIVGISVAIFDIYCCLLLLLVICNCHNWFQFTRWCQMINQLFAALLSLASVGIIHVLTLCLTWCMLLIGCRSGYMKIHDWQRDGSGLCSLFIHCSWLPWADLSWPLLWIIQCSNSNALTFLPLIVDCRDTYFSAIHHLSTVRSCFVTCYQTIISLLVVTISTQSHLC